MACNQYIVQYLVDVCAKHNDALLHLIKHRRSLPGRTLVFIKYLFEVIGLTTEDVNAHKSTILKYLAMNNDSVVWSYFRCYGLLTDDDVYYADRLFLRFIGVYAATSLLGYIRLRRQTQATNLMFVASCSTDVSTRSRCRLEVGCAWMRENH
jgi:hypothetical protein